MTPWLWRRVLLVGSGGLVLAAGGVSWWGVTAGVGEGVMAQSPARGAGALVARDGEGESIQGAWPEMEGVLLGSRVGLQRGLVDVPVKPVEEPQVVEQPAPVVRVQLPGELSLVGTVIEGRESAENSPARGAGALMDGAGALAVFAIGAVQEVRREGETLRGLAGIDVVRVESRRVRVRYQGTEFWLEVPQRKEGGRMKDE